MKLSDFDKLLIAEHAYMKCTGDFPPGRDVPAGVIYTKSYDQRSQDFVRWKNEYGRVVSATIAAMEEYQ